MARDRKSSASGSSSTPKGTLVHIDSDPLAALALQSVFAQSTWLEYIAHASSGAAGIAICNAQKPDFAIADLIFPDMSGEIVISKLSEISPPPRVIVLTAVADDVAIAYLSGAPIHGLVWKTKNALVEVELALGVVQMGARYFPPSYSEAVKVLRGSADAYFKVLSRREIELIPLFAQGMTDDEISARAGITSATVHSHRQRIMGKLNLRSKIALMAWASSTGLLRELRPGAPCVFIP